jgi:hypothetical protein
VGERKVRVDAVASWSFSVRVEVMYRDFASRVDRSVGWTRGRHRRRVAPSLLCGLLASIFFLEIGLRSMPLGLLGAVTGEQSQ